MEIRLNNVRIAFPVLFKPETIKTVPDSKPAYSATFILMPDSTAQTRAADGTWSAADLNRPADEVIKAALAKVATEKWKDKMAGVVELARTKDKICYRPGPRYNSQGAMMAGFENGKWIAARTDATKPRPLVIDGARKEITEADGIIYSGCRVNSLVGIFAYETGSIGIGAGLGAVQFFKDDEPMTGGGRSSADDFEAVAVANKPAEASSPSMSVFD